MNSSSPLASHRSLPWLGGLAAVVIASGLLALWQGVRSRGLPAAVGPEVTETIADGENGSPPAGAHEGRRVIPDMQEEQLRGLYDLAGRLRLKARVAPSAGSRQEADDAAHQALMREVVQLEPAQLRFLIRNLAADTDLDEPLRSGLLARVTTAWATHPGNLTPDQVRPVLDALYEAAPNFHQGYDTPFLTGALTLGVPVNAQACVDFFTDHLEDWPVDNPGGPIRKRLGIPLMKALSDPAHKARLRELVEEDLPVSSETKGKDTDEE